MKNSKRILALIGVILLVLLYVLAMIFAIIDHPMATNLFTAALYATVVVPALIYGYSLIYKVLKNKNREMNYDKEKEE